MAFMPPYRIPEHELRLRKNVHWAVVDMPGGYHRVVILGENHALVQARDSLHSHTVADAAYAIARAMPDVMVNTLLEGMAREPFSRETVPLKATSMPRYLHGGGGGNGSRSSDSYTDTASYLQSDTESGAMYYTDTDQSDTKSDASRQGSSASRTASTAPSTENAPAFPHDIETRIIRHNKLHDVIPFFPGPEDQHTRTMSELHALEILTKAYCIRILPQMVPHGISFDWVLWDTADPRDWTRWGTSPGNTPDPKAADPSNSRTHAEKQWGQVVEPWPENLWCEMVDTRYKTVHGARANAQRLWREFQDIAPGSPLPPELAAILHAWDMEARSFDFLNKVTMTWRFSAVSNGAMLHSLDMEILLHLYRNTFRATQDKQPYITFVVAGASHTRNILAILHSCIPTARTILNVYPKKGDWVPGPQLPIPFSEFLPGKNIQRFFIPQTYEGTYVSTENIQTPFWLPNYDGFALKLEPGQVTDFVAESFFVGLFHRDVRCNVIVLPFEELQRDIEFEAFYNYAHLMADHKKAVIAATGSSVIPAITHDRAGLLDMTSYGWFMDPFVRRKEDGQFVSYDTREINAETSEIAVLTWIMDIIGWANSPAFAWVRPYIKFLQQNMKHESFQTLFEEVELMHAIVKVLFETYGNSNTQKTCTLLVSSRFERIIAMKDRLTKLLRDMQGDVVLDVSSVEHPAHQDLPAAERPSLVPIKNAGDVLDWFNTGSFNPGARDTDTLMGGAKTTALLAQEENDGWGFATRAGAATSENHQTQQISPCSCRNCKKQNRLWSRLQKVPPCRQSSTKK